MLFGLTDCIRAEMKDAGRKDGVCTTLGETIDQVIKITHTA